MSIFGPVEEVAAAGVVVGSLNAISRSQRRRRATTSKKRKKKAKRR